MKTSEKFKRKVLARWRGLSARGVDPGRAAVEIGVGVADLEMWILEAASGSPLFVPVYVEDTDVWIAPACDSCSGRPLTVRYSTTRSLPTPCQRSPFAASPRRTS